ncbi:DNA-binding transcriptional LysR family regulator [Deinobacterium chartae]|uniref:DNA-binding transcriptional LysR family regulator n=1 Tax=Deinobacterium chartae TaxID=521158 RepID=A0A841I0B4_9DEIO|nr:DNA-binding transcriptional LysR family regulator [Deinobacterium chartae]
MKPTLAQLRLFVAVADAGGFSEAAAELGMSQSSLSEAVGNLERALGKPLLRRGRHGVTLTDPGRRALEHARRALMAVDDLILAVAEVAELSGTLRVVSARSAATHLLPPAIAAFRRLHPHVSVELLDSETEAEAAETLLQQGRADLGILPLPARTSLLTWPYFSDEWLGVLPAASAPKRLEWSAFQGVPLILNAASPSAERLIRRHLEVHGVRVNQVQYVGEDSVILGMVKHGLGVTVLPRLAVLPLPDGLAALPLPAPLVRSLGIAVLPRRASLPMIAEFAALLRGRSDGPPPER